MLIRITKAIARKLFAEGKPISLCPCNMYPGGPWNMACLIGGKEWLEKAEGYKSHPDLWKGTVEKTAWDLMYNNWAYYNSECRYAHYYVEE